jgi:hypothetical protein
VRIANAAAVVAVLAAYAFIGSGGTFSFPRLSDSGYSNQADLAEGFRNGHLYLAHDPDPRLAALPNPWDAKARETIHYVWDASYFNGRYYLYFSPLPALIFYLPHRLLRGAYPPDALAATFFSACAFLLAVLFVRRASHLTPLRILLIGLGNLIPFVIVEARVYEVVIATAMTMSMAWALAMLAFHEAPTVARGAWMGIWLALAIAARPNLGVLLLVAVPVVLLARQWKTALAFFIPLAVVGSSMIAYNVARFGTLFEFGTRYQLTHVSMSDYPNICGVRTSAEAGRLCNHALHYLFWSPTVRSQFPFVDLTHAKLDPAVTWPTPGRLTEQVAGLAPVIPLTMLGTFFALLLFGAREARTRAAVRVLAGGWLVLLGLASCWWVVARYALDFQLLIVTSSVVLIDAGMARLREHGLRLMPLRIAIAVLSLYSILLGTLLGLVGPGDAFARNHPETFAAIRGLFHQ